MKNTGWNFHFRMGLQVPQNLKQELPRWGHQETELGPKVVRDAWVSSEVARRGQGMGTEGKKEGRKRVGR